MDFKKIIAALENGGEQLIFASRWLLAPIYLGLSLSLLILLVMFARELWHLATHVTTLTDSQAILGILALVDLALTGSLLIIVIFSGYENFVSKIDHSGHVDWPEWMGTIDFTALKLKLLSSIVAISAIQLLKEFMSLKTVSEDDARKLFWLATIHMVFVISSLMLALSDWVTSLSHANSNGGHSSPNHGPAYPQVTGSSQPEPEANPTRAPDAGKSSGKPKGK